LHARNHATSFPAHTHQTFNITLILSQTFGTKVQERMLEATVGSIVITNPDEVHASFCDAHLGTTFFTFYVSPDVMYSLAGGKRVFFDDKVIHDDLVFDALFSISKSLDKNPQVIELELLQTLRQLVQKYATDSAMAPKTLLNLRRHVDDLVADKFSLEHAARSAGIDKFKFLRLFKYETGLTPNNYILLKRIDRCKQLLQTESELLEIAIRTGFYDATHLCKHFRQITGITPTDYRKALAH
jgi:AraC-like DNA-binding protein